MNKEARFIVAAVVTIIVSSFMAIGGLAASDHGQAPGSGVPDSGEARAADYYRQKDRCAVIMQYGAKPGPVGPITGDPEKDTYAYPVKGTDNVCKAARS